MLLNLLQFRLGHNMFSDVVDTCVMQLLLTLTALHICWTLMLCRTTLQTLLSVTLSRNWFVHNNILLNYFNLRNLITDFLINFNYFYKKNIVGKYFMLTEVNDPLFFFVSLPILTRMCLRQLIVVPYTAQNSLIHHAAQGNQVTDKQTQKHLQLLNNSLKCYVDLLFIH